MLCGRRLYSKLETHLENKEFTVITGARQTGKTSLLKMIFNQLKAKDWAVYYLTLEDPEVLTLLNQKPQNLFALTQLPKNVGFGQSIVPKDKLYVLIDKIQYLKDPSNFLKLLYDLYADSLKLVVTGSSAFYIDRKFKDSLVGRKRIFWLKTLDFEEFLHFRNADHLAEELNRLKNTKGAISTSISEIKTLFTEYLTYGGYPAVVLQKNTEDKKFLLDEIKNSYIRRDIHESDISNEIAFMHLLRLLASQTGLLVNRNELSMVLRIDNKTVDNYLYVLQKCFHIELLKPFIGNVRKEITKMPKVYFYDSGLRNALLNRFSPLHEREDRGQLIENYVFRRLSDMYDPEQINFWRTADNHEVDFMVSESFQKGFSLEVKFDTANAKISKYKLFTSNYPAYPLKFAGFHAKTDEQDILML